MHKSGQVWIETVLYTLIAFAMIGIVLAYAKPEIQKIQDKRIIEDSVQMLTIIEKGMREIKQVPGNQRTPTITIKKGSLEIDGANDVLVFRMESEYAYTEPGKDVELVEGNIISHTKKLGDINEIKLTSNYSDKYDIKYKGEDQSKLLNKASTPYKIVISNEGQSADDKTIININF